MSVEDQERADERIPDLLAVPAAVRFLSCEPLLESINIERWLNVRYGQQSGREHGYSGETRISWVIVGGESGPRARPFALSWAYSLLKQCREGHAIGVPCFIKQLGHQPRRADNGWDYLTLRDKKGADPTEWPADLRVQQFPE